MIRQRTLADTDDSFLDRTYNLALYCDAVHDLRYAVNCFGIVIILEEILQFRNNMSIFVHG